MSPRAFPGTRLSASPLPSPQKVDTGWQRDSWTLPVVLGPEPKNRGCRFCTWLVEGGPTGPHLQPRVFLPHCRGEPSGGLWSGAMRGKRPQGKAGEGCEVAGRLALPPGPQLLEASTRMALFTGGHGPRGRVCYLQARQQADSCSWPQRTWRSAFVGGLTHPGRRGAWGTFFPWHCLP